MSACLTAYSHIQALPLGKSFGYATSLSLHVINNSTHGHLRQQTAVELMEYPTATSLGWVLLVSYSWN